VVKVVQSGLGFSCGKSILHTHLLLFW